MCGQNALVCEPTRRKDTRGRNAGICFFLFDEKDSRLRNRHRAHRQKRMTIHDLSTTATAVAQECLLENGGNLELVEMSLLESLTIGL